MVKTLITETQIQERLKQIAAQINKAYDKVTLLVVLSGGMYTAVDLSKYLTIPVRIEYIKVSSYGNGKKSGKLTMQYMSAELDEDLGNVFIIDDTCDTGRTLKYIEDLLDKHYECKVIRSFTLLNKPGKRETNINPSCSGFVIQDDLFVYGYGLDDKGYNRNKTHVYTTN